MAEYHGIWRNITEYAGISRNMPEYHGISVYHDIFPEYTGTSQYFPIVANATVYKHERLTTYFITKVLYLSH
jgi:hypothetical protein